jgi:hypothetical protein
MASASSPAPEAPQAAVAACAAELAAIEAAPALPGDPALDAHREEIFARAKADGVIFLHAPAPKGLTNEGKWVRHSIVDAAEPVKALYDAYPRLGRRRDLAREALLTDGYLYATAPAFAAALSALVRPEDLFLEPRIWIQRGAETFSAVRGSAEGAPAYVYASGPSKGARVKLFLFDRVATTETGLADPQHADAAALSRELGFEELRVRRLGDGGIAADLRYGTVWVPSVLAVKDAALALRCEAMPSGAEAEVRRVRADATRRERALARLHAVIDQEVAEGLPFDEPRTEVGQQDGKLRQHWNWAYRFGQSQFEFNDDRYRVFDAVGRPRVPQVCIDFVTDTFERASGSWYRARGEPRERTPGRVNFASFGIDNERSVEHFVEFAKAHPEWFEVFELPDEERVPYAHRADFFAHLAAHKERYRPGDVVTIYGLRGDGKMHYHSFFVYSADPVTGAPSLVAANAGRPRVRPFEGEMQSAPQRSIRARIRPLQPWLELVTAETPSAAPPSASVGAGAPRPTAI